MWHIYGLKFLLPTIPTIYNDIKNLKIQKRFLTLKLSTVWIRAVLFISVVFIKLREAVGFKLQALKGLLWWIGECSPLCFGSSGLGKINGMMFQLLWDDCAKSEGCVSLQ